MKARLLLLASALVVTAACGKTTTHAAIATPVHATSVEVWASKWCQAQPGMTKAQVLALMGKPTVDNDTPGGLLQSSWDTTIPLGVNSWGFTAIYWDTDGTVADLNATVPSGEHLACSDARKAAQ